MPRMYVLYDTTEDAVSTGKGGNDQERSTVVGRQSETNVRAVHG